MDEQRRRAGKTADASTSGTAMLLDSQVATARASASVNATASVEGATRATYRLLLLRGFAPNEAANLTAFLSGIPVGNQQWKLVEINRLLFLRQLNRSGRFRSLAGPDDSCPMTGE